MSLLNFMDFLFTLHFHPLSKPVPLLPRNPQVNPVSDSCVRTLFGRHRHTIHHTVISDWTGLTPCTLRHILSFRSSWSSFTISFIHAAMDGGGPFCRRRTDCSVYYVFHMACSSCFYCWSLLVLLPHRQLLWGTPPPPAHNTTSPAAAGVGGGHPGEHNREIGRQIKSDMLVIYLTNATSCTRARVSTYTILTTVVKNPHYPSAHNPHCCKPVMSL